MKTGDKRVQIWVETVIYTLIALILIGAVLAFIIPKVEEIQDKAIIEQSITMMKSIDNIIISVIRGGPGNKRIIDLGIKKGTLKIDSAKDEIVFEIQSEYVYSEIGEKINIGSIVVLTEETQTLKKITLTSSYSKYDLTYNGKNETKSISQASTPYKFSIENKGGAKVVIDIIIS